MPKWRWMIGTSAAKPARLAPDENTVSCEEVSTTQRTSSSSRAASKAAISSPSSSFESALRVSGWLSVTVATPSLDVVEQSLEVGNQSP